MLARVLTAARRHQVARTNELLRIGDSGSVGALPSLINLADDATDAVLHFVPPGGLWGVIVIITRIMADDFLTFAKRRLVCRCFLILSSDSTVGSNPQGPRHMQLTVPDVQPVPPPPPHLPF